MGEPVNDQHLAEILENGRKEIAAFFQERNWPDTKLGNAASAIDYRMKQILAALRTPPPTAPLGYVLVELDRLNALTERLKALVEAGSADAQSLALDAALLLEARHG